MEDKLDILFKLRKSLNEAIETGIVSKDKNVIETTLLSIFNECKKQELRCSQLQDDYIRKAAEANAQKNAYSQMQSIVYAIFNSVVQSVKENNVEKKLTDDGLTEEEKKKEEEWRQNKLSEDLTNKTKTKKNK